MNLIPKSSLFKVRIVLVLLALAAFTLQLSPAMAQAISCHLIFKGNHTRSLLESKPSLFAQATEYLSGTLQSLEGMRGASSLVRDTLWIQETSFQSTKMRVLNPNTSPTNIASDLIVHTELLLRSEPRNSQKIAKTLSNVVSVLSRIPRHRSSGLFFSWYSTDLIPQVASHNISSIDNLHLAIALWTIHETFPGTILGQQALALFEPMNFSMFYDVSSGLIGGNFRLDGGTWSRDSYNFSNLGSEARILYTAGWALGLFKDFSPWTQFAAKGIAALDSEVIETAQGPMLRLWDGSAFQLFFPKMFVSEESFSRTFSNFYKTSGEYMISEGVRRKLAYPAAHSPGVAQIIQPSGGEAPYAFYNDKAGNKRLVSRNNQDLKDPEMAGRWDQTFTPYAFFMAATVNPSRFLPILAEMENLAPKNQALYTSEMGWRDGVHVSGAQAGQVVPAQLAVNQGMIGLSLLQMQAPDGMSASGRAFQRNPEVSQKMKHLYMLIEKNLNKQK